MQKYFLVNYEKKCLDFGAVLFTSKYDHDKVVGKGKKYNSYIIPNVYPENLKIDNGKGDGYEKKDTFLYIGALDYGPNIEGLKWFLNTIFSHVKIHIKDAQLLVVGRKPTTEVRDLCSSIPNVELHPDVPDVKPFYKQCGIVVVPILTGGGTRIKILEAGIACRPVLSTPAGAQGLEVTNGKDLFFFTDKRTFLESYNKLNNKDVYDSTVKKLKCLVKDLYSPESFNGKMREAIKSIGYF